MSIVLSWYAAASLMCLLGAAGWTWAAAIGGDFESFHPVEFVCCMALVGAAISFALVGVRIGFGG